MHSLKSNGNNIKENKQSGLKDIFIDQHEDNILRTQLGVTTVSCLGGRKLPCLITYNTSSKGSGNSSFQAPSFPIKF